MTGKMTRAQALELGGNASNVFSMQREQKELQSTISKFMETDLFWKSDVWIKKLGKPSTSIPEFESNPGIWVFLDNETGIKFLIWSDCHRKNAYKGTSYESIIPENKTIDLNKSFSRLLEYLNSLQ